MKTVDVITFHNVSIQYEAASLLNRGLALGIDLLCMLLYYVITFITLISFEGSILNHELLTVLLFIIIILPMMLYSLIFEFLFKGQTIGKMALGIRVVTLNGENAGLGDYVLRWSFRIVDFWFSAGAIAALFITTTERGQRLGDILSQTAVIRNKPNQLYSVSDLLTIKDRSTHEPIYLNVTRFTDEDMILIKNAISRVKLYPNQGHKDFIQVLAEKAAFELQLSEVPEKKLAFLKVLLQDYVVLTR